ncbi:MAG TPA: J domain-containing protein, partial [Polyangiales bacterium]|nr:J domain-containing protein [Polyangiales bacterium]
MNRGVDVYKLPLNTKEGFVLSRIDDVASVEDIAIMVGLKLNDLMSILDRLADLGAVQLSWRPVKPKAAPPAPTPAANTNAEPDSAGLKGEDHPAVQRALAPPPIQPYTEGELEEYGDLSEAQKRRVLVAFYGLEGKNYYQLLGLDQDADKKAVRSAYFELSRLFHPDSMFGKNLGTFKTKMETVFKRLTEAYEVLGRSQRRKEYDEYLASMVTTSVLQNRFDSVESQVRALSTAPPQHQRPQTPVVQASANSGGSSASSGSSTSSAGTPASAARAVHQTPPPQQPTAAAAAAAPDPRRISQVGQRPPATLEERKAQARERLRRSFAGSASQVGSTSAAVPNRTAQGSQPIATSASTDRTRQTGARQSSVGAGGIEAVLAHLRRAKDAEAAGDLLGAAAALQSALALQPEHKDLQAQYERVSSAVTRTLAENYEKQARYEEKQLKWAAAAVSWERVSDGRPESAEAARAVAESLLK